MNNKLDQLSRNVCSKLRTLGFSSPRAPVMTALLNAAFLASLKTEEGRYPCGSLTFSDPGKPETDPPPCRRADYPSFTPLGHGTPLQTAALVKLFRAVNRWSGSLAVYGTHRSRITIGGIVDQLVQHNIRLNREAPSGFAGPGIVTVNIEGVADISVYHADVFLGRLTQDNLVTQETDALGSAIIASCLVPKLRPIAESIALALKPAESGDKIMPLLLEAWINTVSRICIGLRRLGTGGSLLITPKPLKQNLEVVHPFNYPRLGDSTALNVLDDLYHLGVEWSDPGFTQPTSPDYATELGWAEADAQDRASELTAAIKLVTSLATADGLVLMDQLLRIRGFGVKIKAGTRLPMIYDGKNFQSRGTAARKIDPSQFGTRHGSMLRYCHTDPSAIGIVVSQDGHVRVIASAKGSLLLWQNARLLGYNQDVAAYARELRRMRKSRSTDPMPDTLGYTRMPKTMRVLLSLRK